LAIGKPVAFEASAEERETRGFISMTSRSPVSGSTANWMFEPPVSTPTRRMQAKAASRISWYSTSDSVWAGATVIESPVCTPIGSTFSIEHTTTQLSARSRITSSSNSFQPAIERSTRISETGLAARPAAARCRSWSRSAAMPVPAPPRMNDGRTMIGKPICSPMARASSRSWAKPESGHSRPISIIAFLNSSRSSAVRIASVFAPMSSTRCSSSTPRAESSIARLSAVWPPIVGRSASGRSRATIAASTSASSGST